MKTSISTKGLLLSILILSSIQVSAIQGAVNNSVFKDGEKISYDVHYKWGLISMHAGRADFSVSETVYNNIPSYKFSVAGSSLKTFDKFYRIRDTLESIAGKNDLLPSYFKRVANEDSYWAQDEFHFIENSSKTVLNTDCRRRNDKRTLDTLSFNETVTDLVTAFYRIRNLDISSMKKNERVSFAIVYDDDGKSFNLNFKYLGKEEITVNGKKYRCLKLQPLVIKGKIFKDDKALNVWISDDENKIPILIEAKIIVGTVKATLSKSENIRYPLTSIIETKK